MENVQGENNEVEKLSILSIQNQRQLIETLKKDIGILNKLIEFYEKQINIPDIKEEDRKNYLLQIEELKIKITDLERSVEGFERSIEILSSSILEKIKVKSGPRNFV